MKILVLIGAPGSGKGTQAKQIVDKYGYEHVSTGDMLREEISQKSLLGLEAKKAIDAGQLVSDEIVIGMMKTKLQTIKSNGCVLDGFPRTLAQAEKLSKMLIEEYNKDIDKVIYINVSLNAVIDRMAGRLTCSVCGASYHKIYNMPLVEGVCDLDGSKLYVREDDVAEVVHKRFDTYMLNTFPVIAYYKHKNLLDDIDGEIEIAKITEKIFSSLEF